MFWLRLALISYICLSPAALQLLQSGKRWTRPNRRCFCPKTQGVGQQHVRPLPSLQHAPQPDRSLCFTLIIAYLTHLQRLSRGSKPISWPDTRALTRGANHVDYRPTGNSFSINLISPLVCRRFTFKTCFGINRSYTVLTRYSVSFARSKRLTKLNRYGTDA